MKSNKGENGGDPAPEQTGNFKPPGSAIPAEASRREMVGMEGIAPPRLPDSKSGPSAIRVEPHAREIGSPSRSSESEGWHSRQDSHLQPRRSKRRTLII
jgi:hypothetical protein